MYKTTFILHTKYHTQLKKLSPEQVGLLHWGAFTMQKQANCQHWMMPQPICC